MKTEDKEFANKLTAYLDHGAASLKAGLSGPSDRQTWRHRKKDGTIISSSPSRYEIARL